MARWTPARRASRPAGLSVGTYLAVRAVCVGNAVLLVIVGVLLAIFMQHPAGLIGAGLCWLTAGFAAGGAGWLDRAYRRS